MKKTIRVLAMAACLLLSACNQRTPPFAQSSLSLTERSEVRVVFDVQLRRGDSIRVGFGQNGTIMAMTPVGDKDEIGQVIVKRPGVGLEITGQLFRIVGRSAKDVRYSQTMKHTDGDAEDVKILENIKEEDGRFRVATYSKWGNKDIPLYVYVDEKQGSR